MVRFCSIIVSVLFVFVFLLAVHQWNVDNQARYAIVEDTLVILRIIIGVQFAVGIKIISDAIEQAIFGACGMVIHDPCRGNCSYPADHGGCGSLHEGVLYGVALSRNTCRLREPRISKSKKAEVALKAGAKGRLG